MSEGGEKQVEVESKTAHDQDQAPAKSIEAPLVHVTSCEKHSARFVWERNEYDDDLDVDGWRLSFTLELASSADSNWKEAYCGPDQGCEVEGLSSGHKYVARIRVQASPLGIGGDEGPLSEPIPIKCSTDPSPIVSFTTLPSPPSAPAPPSLASRERKALKLKWAQPEEPGGSEPLSYSLYCSPPPSSSIQVEEGSIKARDAAVDALPVTYPCDSEGFAEVYQGDERAFKVTKLLPGIRYTFRLKASNSLGSSPVSQCSTFTTQATVPSPPEEPMILSTSSNSVTLVWWSPQDNGSPITSYRLEVDQGRKIESGAGGTNHVSSYELAYVGTATTATVVGLKHGLLYSFRLLAENAEGKSLWSSSILSSTSAVPPDSPSSLLLKGQPTIDSCTIAWTPPHDNGGSKVDAYEVQLQAKGAAAIELMGNDWLVIFSGEAMGCAIASLRSGCSYRCRVRAKNSSGWGLFCIPIDITTAPNVPDAPRAPTSRTHKPRSLGIEWSQPAFNGGSTVTGFKVMIAQSVPCSCSNCPLDPSHLPKRVLIKPCEESLPGNFVVDAVSGHVQNMDIDDLTPSQHYFIRVQAGNPVGYSEWSPWARFLTPPDAPSFPVSPIAQPVGPGSLSISWTAPEDDHGSPVHTYVVEMAPTPLHPEPKPRDPIEGDDGAERRSHKSHSGTEVSSCPIHTQTETLNFKVIYQGSVTGCEARGLPPASSFVFRVRAVNHAGSSEWSKESRPALTPPSTPGPVHAFTVVSLLTLPSPSSSPPIPSSRNSARSAGGDSTRSRSSSHHEELSHEVIDPPPPSLPLNPTRCIQVSWAPPMNDNGSAVACYSVEMAPLGRVKAISNMSTLPNPSASKGPPFALSYQKKAPGPGHPPPLSSPMTSASYPLPTPSQNLQWSVVYSGPSTGCIVDRLPPGRSYAFRVRASNQMGWGVLCDCLATSTLPGAPSPPSRLIAASISGQQAASLGKGDQGKKGQSQGQGQGQGQGAGLKVKWDPPDDDNGAPLLSYILELAEAAGLTSDSTLDSDQPQALEWKSVYHGTDSTTRVSDLHPGHQYWLRVRGCNAAGEGEACGPLMATTSLSPPSPPSQVRTSLTPTKADGPKKDKGGSFTLEVTWDPPPVSPYSAPPIGFEALLLPSDLSPSQPSANNYEQGKGSVRVNVAKGEDKVVIPGLGPGLCYTVRVRAVGADGAGHSLWSTDVKFTTPPSGPASGVKSLPQSSSHSSLIAAAAVHSLASSTEESDESNLTQVLPVVTHATNQQSTKGTGGRGKGNRVQHAESSSALLSSNPAAPSIPPAPSHTPPLARRVANSTSRTWKAWRKVMNRRISAWLRLHILKIFAAIFIIFICLTWRTSWFQGILNN